MKIEKSKLVEKIDFEKMNQLVPCIVQNHETNQVLMLGYMNEESLEKTLKTGLVTFYSRSRKSLWTKGETSGNILKLVSIDVDCDQDAILIQVNPKGPTCHKGNLSCFDTKANTLKDPGNLDFLLKLEQVIESRREDTKENNSSYVNSLFKKGINKISQKVGEEAVETVIATLNEDKDSFLNESADLVFHLLILLRAKNTSLAEIATVLEDRHTKK